MSGDLARDGRGKENERLRAELHEERALAARIADISAALIAATTEDDFSRVMLDEVGGAFGGTGTLVAFVKDGRVRISRGANHVITRDLNGSPLTAARPLAQVIRTGRMLFIHTREEFADRWPAAAHLLTATNARAWACIPFGTGESTVGAFTVIYDTEYRPSAAERALMRTFGHLAGQALERIKLQRRLRGQLEVERERAARITSISAALISAATEDELSRVILDEVAAAFGGSGILLAFAENGRLRMHPGHGFDARIQLEMDGLPLSAPRPLTHSIRSGEPLFIPSREDFAARWPAAAHLLDLVEAVSFVEVPFGAEDRQSGAWCVLYDHEYLPAEEERALFLTLAHLAGQALERIRLQHARLELARVLQRSMLPSLLDPVPGVELAARYTPAQDGLDIGGDWYDAFPLGDGTLALVIGDVQGHDVDAAALMGQVRTSIRAFASRGEGPGTVLGSTNDLLIGMNVGAFASCTFLHYDPRTGTCRAARAGHVPLVWALGDGTHGLLDIEGGPVLGVLAHADYPTLTCRLDPEALLVMVTDGVVEGPAQSLETGLRRMGELAAQAHKEGIPLEEAADRLLAVAATVGHIDDAALLLVRKTWPTSS